MKKILLVLAGVVFATPFFVSAQALTDQFEQSTQVQSSCVNLQNNMSYRSRDAQTNGDVSALQDFLASRGYLSAEPTGYFGLQTVEAVKKFQIAIGIGGVTTPGFGGVGPLTRSKINTMSCSNDAISGTNTTTTTVTAGVTPTSGLPAGCTSSKGFSSTTGKSCYVTVVNPVSSSFPAGCTSAVGFSYLTGASCMSNTTTTTPTVSLPAGCLSASGYSSVDGNSCGGTTQLLIPRVASMVSSGNTVGEVSKITVNGSNFSSTSVLAYTNTTTSFSGKLTNPNSWSASQLVFYVDKYIGNVSGNYRAQVINIKGSASQSSNEVAFVVSPILPAGCLSASGYSSVDGNSCGGEVASAPVINEVSSKGGSAGELYATTNGYIVGTGLKGSLTINVGGRLVYVNSTSDTVVTFAVPAFSIYPASGIDVVVTKGSLKSNVYKVTVSLLYPIGCTSNTGFSSVGGHSCSGQAIQAPSVTFSANPSSVNSGQSALLSWGSSNATSCSSSGDGSSWGWPSARYTSGAQYTPALTTTQTYTMSCSGAGGTTSKSVTVSVDTTPTTSSVPTVEFLGAPTLALQYESSTGNEVLVGDTTVKVTAGSTDVRVSDIAYAITSLSLGSQSVRTNSMKYSAVVTSNGATVTGSYMIPVGVSVVYKIKTTSLTKELFAGTYSLRPSMLSYLDTNGTFKTIEASSFKNAYSSNSITIVGEKSPYLTIVYSDPSSKTVAYAIQGVRFSPTSNLVTINGVTKTMPSESTFSTSGATVVNSLIRIPSLADFGIASIGEYPVQVTHPTYGASNKLMLTVNQFQVPTVPTVPTATVTSGPTLQLSYDSDSKESVLTASAMVSVTAGSADLVILKAQGSGPSPFSYFTMRVKDTAGHEGPLKYNNLHIDLSPFLLEFKDNGGYWTIPAGKTAQFSISQTFNPNQMFAGVYHAAPYLYSVENYVATNILSAKDGNLITLVGERAPYVTYATVGSTGNVEILAYRMNFKDNKVTFGGGTGVLSATPSGSLWVMNFKPSQFGVIAAGSYPLQISTAEGASNIINVNVSAPVVVAPSSNQFASIIGAFAKPATPTPVVAPKWSYNWAHNLELGSGYLDDVAALQTALTKEGVYSGEATGGFYAQTFQAVKVFQMEHGIESTGFVGPQTREKLNELYK